MAASEIYVLRLCDKTIVEKEINPLTTNVPHYIETSHDWLLYDGEHFFYLGFVSRTFTIHTQQQGKGEGIYLISLYYFHPLHRHLDISRAITAESSTLHIASSRTQTGNLWFPNVGEHWSLMA